MKSNFKENLITLQDFPFIKAFLGELHDQFFEEMIM